MNPFSTHCVIRTVTAPLPRGAIMLAIASAIPIENTHWRCALRCDSRFLGEITKQTRQLQRCNQKLAAQTRCCFLERRESKSIIILFTGSRQTTRQKNGDDKDNDASHLLLDNVDRSGHRKYRISRINKLFYHNPSSFAAWPASLPTPSWSAAPQETKDR